MLIFSIIAALENFGTRLNSKLSARCHLTNNKNRKITAISVNVDGRTIQLVNDIVYFYFRLVAAAQREDDSRGENLLKAPVNQSRNNLQPGRNEMISHVDREIIDASK